MVSIASCPISGHPLRRAWLRLLHLLPSAIHTHWWDPPEPSLLHTEQCQLSQPFLIWDMISHMTWDIYETVITQWLRLEGNLRSHLVLCHCLRRLNYSRLPRTMSSPLIIFAALCWILSSSSVSPLYWGAGNKTPGVSSPALSRREGSPPSQSWQHSS